MKLSETNVTVRKPLPLRVTRGTFVEIISSLLILLFVYAAASKLQDYAVFNLQLSKSPFVTEYSDVIAWMIPLAEIMVALSLISKKTRLLGLYASLFLMAMFTAYIYAMLHYSYDLPCSCGGILSSLNWIEHFWFNIMFVLMSVLGILLLTAKQEQS